MGTTRRPIAGGRFLAATTASPAVVEEHDGLRWLVVEHGWSPEFADLVKSGRVDGIELNASKGEWGEDLGFLREVPALKNLILINLAERDVEPIGALTHLVNLRLSAYAVSPLDFSGLRSLRSCFVEWRKQYLGISACTSLEELYVNRYPARDLGMAATLIALQKLRIGDSRVLASLDGISSLRRLQFLGLYALPQLASLEPLEEVASTLETLEVRACRRFGSLAGLERLTRLQRLVLEDCGKVDSIVPIGRLDTLTQFYFYGDTNEVDGKLDILGRLKLRQLSFMHRRHYSLRREELQSFRR